jgi:cell division protease FtsH
MDGLRRQQWVFTLVYVVVATLVLYEIRNLLQIPQPTEVAYSEFLQRLRGGELTEIEVSDTRLVGRLRSSQQLIATTRLPGVDESALFSELASRDVKVSGHIDIRPWWVDLITGWFMPLAIFGLIYGYGMRRMAQGSAGPLTFGKNRAKIYDRSSTNPVTFNDVAGVDEAKTELLEIVDFLRDPSKYQRLGGRIPKGVLLVGPPGTGKTLLAKAVAGEAHVPFFIISGSEFVEMFVGVGAARVRDLFEEAKRKAPCIVFIDEIDAIGKSRAGAAGVMLSHDEREQTLNQLLVEMDGFDTSKGIIIMAATNTPEVLDPALLRPGRFDRQVVIDRPDLKGREAILRVHTRTVKLDSAVKLDVIAARTPGMSGADLANIVNEAALLAARRNADRVEMRDLEEAIDRVILGLKKKTGVMTPQEKERVAYHESGHTLVALSVEHADPVHRVSIIPRSVGALGHTLQLPTHERYLMTRPELEDQIAVMLGGRAAEEIVYGGVISTGAANDLERASELIRQMITRFGMSEHLGQLCYGRPLSSRFLPGLSGEQRNYSERTAELIDEEAQRVMARIYDKVKAILTVRRGALERIAQALIAKETIDRDQLDQLLAETTCGKIA